MEFATQHKIAQKNKKHSDSNNLKQNQRMSKEKTEEIKAYTLSILTENEVGLMQRVVTAFTKRKINIDSFIASETENKDIYRFTIVIRSTARQVEKVAKSLETILEVFRVIVYEDEDLVYQELALYKIPTQAVLDSNQIETIVRQNNARILSVGKEYTIIEKTGHKERTQELFDILKPFGILAFTRSGRIAVSSKKMDKVNKYLEKQLEKDPATFN